ncbi:MAG: glycoside hydrolase family 27 protein [Spirosomataceae bacterium]
MIKHTFWMIGILISSRVIFAQIPSAQLAPTPPMGWNSYNAFGATVEESEVRANAEYVAKNLKQHGWNYVVIDFCWWYPHPPGSNQSNPPQFKLKSDGSLVPYFQMDEYGRLYPDVRRFPSAAGGKGFKALADYVHSLGLKFGIHVMRGIPRQAVWYNTKVLGTNNIRAKDVVDTTSVCNWLNNMWGVNMTKSGGQEYYNSILQLYADWGVDFIKLDDTDMDEKYPYRREEVSAFHQAIDKTKRPIVLSLSLNMKYENREHAKENAEMWRISKDYWDSWEQLEEQFPLCAKWAHVADPGNWPDADMLQLGKIAKRGPVGQERFSRFTEDEQITHFTLWCIAQSPLMFGGNLPENTPFVNSLITNDEAIAVNQQGSNPKEVYFKEEKVVWMSKNKDGSINVALFNHGKEAKDMEVTFEQLGLNPKSKYRVRDLWKKQDLDQIKVSLSQKINAHGAGLYRLVEVK